MIAQRGPLLWTDFIKVCIVSSEPTHRSALAPPFCRLAVKYCHQRHSGTEFKGKRFIILLEHDEFCKHLQLALGDKLVDKQAMWECIALIFLYGD